MDRRLTTSFMCPRVRDLHKGHKNITDNMFSPLRDNNKDTSYIDTDMSDTKENGIEKRTVKSEVLLSELKRTERLSAGLYMVTNCISDTEPMKWKLREKSLALLSDMNPLHDMSTLESTARLKRAEDQISEIITLLHVAYAGDLISEMNMKVLQEEYLILRSHIEKGSMVKGVTERAVAVLFEGDQEENNTDTFDTLEKRYGAYEEKARSLKGHIKDTRYAMSDKDIMSDRVRYVETGGREERGAKREGFIAPAQKMLEKNTPERTSVDVIVMKEKRRKHIVSVIKKRGRVGIKDITSAITDTSEKTIQRELAAMVQDGIVKKEGEKRWSIYSLA
jgi:DNA-binding transcriptional ArsR family regulator